MKSLLQEIPNTCVYLDDILITGKIPDEHLYNLDLVLNQIKSAGL